MQQPCKCRACRHDVCNACCYKKHSKPAWCVSTVHQLSYWDKNEDWRTERQKDRRRRKRKEEEEEEEEEEEKTQRNKAKLKTQYEALLTLCFSLSPSSNVQSALVACARPWHLEYWMSHVTHRRSVLKETFEVWAGTWSSGEAMQTGPAETFLSL